jgi:hypothetical protein
MVARIKELIDDSGAEIATAGWLPGSDDPRATAGHELVGAC